MFLVADEGEKLVVPAKNDETLKTRLIGEFGTDGI
jgi:hypothetical protein